MDQIVKENGEKIRKNGFSIRIPEIKNDTLTQDKEWCIVKYQGEEKRIRFHDYHEIFDIPGLYETLFYDVLDCNSPETVCSLLKQEIENSSISTSDLSVLDLGAGNGMVAEELSKLGASTLVGVDIIDEAAKAAERDRPGLYDHYVVADFTDVPEPVDQKLDKIDFNCLATVSALGFGDIPPLAFAQAYNYISTPGWVAFNIKDRFLEKNESSGFSKLIQEMFDCKIMKLKAQKRYRHRNLIDGNPLYYTAIVGTKESDIPGSILENLE